MPKLVFMGTPSYAARILSELIACKFDIVAVFTGADKPVGRKQSLKMSEVKALALEKIPQTPIFTPKTLKDETILKQIKAFKPDFIIVGAYGKILPKELLDFIPCINLHASLLPKYRGASPIQSAILNADEISGVCTMLMNEKLDGGAILESESLNIKDKKADEVFELMSNLAAKLCISTLQNFHKLKALPQDESKASFCVKIRKENGLIHLENAKTIYQQFLAFYPWPGVFLENGLKFIELEFVDNEPHSEAGEILGLEKEAFLLACKMGTLRIKALQESGKKILNARTYLNGKRLGCGDNLCR